MTTDFPDRGATPRDYRLKAYIDAGDYAIGGVGTWLSGHGAPGSASDLNPLDGVSDPWRWSDGWGGWVSPAYEVTWAEGDVIPATEEPNVAVTVTGGALLTGALFSASLSPTDPAESAGSGIGFVVQYEENFTHTTVPDAELDPATLFGDFVVGAPYEFPEVSTGSDGQWYVDLDTRDLYGPRADGEWVHFSTLPAPG